MSKINPIFRAKIEKGKLNFVDKNALLIWIDNLEGKNVEVIIQKERDNRTKAENNYYWGVIVELLSKELGYSPDDIHELLKLKFNSKIVNWKGKEIRIPKSTATLKIEEFEDYCERIRIWASQELNIIVPLPNEVVIEV